MGDILPIVLILVIFPLSFWAGKSFKGLFRAVLALVVMLFFVIMAFVDSGHRYRYLLFAILAAGFLFRIAKASGWLSRSGSNSAR